MPGSPGYTINYYYFGYVETAALGLLGGVRPEVAFNLMSITLPAMTFCGASGIVYDLLGRWRRGSPSAVAASAARAGGARRRVAGRGGGKCVRLRAFDQRARRDSPGELLDGHRLEQLAGNLRPHRPRQPEPDDHRVPALQFHSRRYPPACPRAADRAARGRRRARLLGAPGGMACLGDPALSCSLRW